MRHGERAKFAAAATSAGADYLEFVLLAPPETAISRYRNREHHIDHVVEALGGETVIQHSHDRVTAYLIPGTTVVDATGDVDRTYRTLIAELD